MYWDDVALCMTYATLKINKESKQQKAKTHNKKETKDW